MQVKLITIGLIALLALIPLASATPLPHTQEWIDTYWANNLVPEAPEQGIIESVFSFLQTKEQTPQKIVPFTGIGKKLVLKPDIMGRLNKKTFEDSPSSMSLLIQQKGSVLMNPKELEKTKHASGHIRRSVYK